MKTHLIAYTKDSNGNCTSVAYVCNLNDTELDLLLSQEQQHKQELANERQELLSQIKRLENKCNSLEQEIKVLKGEDENEEVLECCED